MIDDINAILSEWNPLGLPHEIAQGIQFLCSCDIQQQSNDDLLKGVFVKILHKYMGIDKVEDIKNMSEVDNIVMRIKALQND